jgi:hypothetical protein
MQKRNLAFVRLRHGVITLESKDYKKIKSQGFYFTITRKKTTYGYYYQCLVCKKINSKLFYRRGLAAHIMRTPKWKHTDHIDRNPLNNVRSKTRFKGVYKMKSGRFGALVKKGTLAYSVKSFKKDVSAAKAYNKLASWVFGEYAGLNKL